MVEARTPGRPRSEQSHQAILTAALDLASDVGYVRMTVEGIAARAGVGKQTIYRWWPSKADVLLEACAAGADMYVPTKDHGSYEADLRAFLVSGYELAGRPHVVDILRALIAEAQIDVPFGDRFRLAFLERRRKAIAMITDRARGRGDLPSFPDPGTVADIIFGTLWCRVLASRRPLDERLIQDLLTLLTGTRPETPPLLTLRPTTPAVSAPLPWRSAAGD